MAGTRRRDDRGNYHVLLAHNVQVEGGVLVKGHFFPLSGVDDIPTANVPNPGFSIGSRAGFQGGGPLVVI